jgi:hypothetical protein
MIRMATVFDSAEVGCGPYHAFRKQEPGGEGTVVAGGAHDDSERPAVQANLERLLDRREVVRQAVSTAAGTPDPGNGHGAILLPFRSPAIVRHGCGA